MSVYFWALYSVPLIHVSIFVPISCSFDYYSLVVLFELSAVDLCFPKSSTVIGTGRYVEICFLTKPNFKLQLDVTAGPQNWKVSVFIPIPKRSSANECSYYYTIVLISHSSKVILKILQASLQQYVNWELPDVQVRFRKGRGATEQIANIPWIIEKAREFLKNVYFCFIDYAKAFDGVDHRKLWKFLKEMWIPDHLTCFMRNLYANQEERVRTKHGTMDWFTIGEGIGKGYICHTVYLTYMQSTSWEMPV